MVNQQMGMFALQLHPKSGVIWDKTVLKERKEQKEVNELTIEGIKSEFPSVFVEDSIFGDNPNLQEIKVCDRREINWKTRPQEIPLMNMCVVYDVGKVPKAEVIKYLGELKKSGVISQLEWSEK